jgi:hypothetical protein
MDRELIWVKSLSEKRKGFDKVLFKFEDIMGLDKDFTPEHIFLYLVNRDIIKCPQPRLEEFKQALQLTNKVMPNFLVLKFHFTEKGINLIKTIKSVEGNQLKFDI